MADISKLVLPGGNEYDIKDATARSLISGKAGISVTSTTIAVSDWSNSNATKNVSGVTSSNTILVSPDPSSHSVASASGIYCSAQGSGTLTFTVNKTPTDSITMNVMIIS